MGFSGWCHTRNTFDCDQSNVLYSPRVLFSCLFLQIYLFVLSLYTIRIGWLVTLPCEVSVQSPIICVNSHYRLGGQVCVDAYSELDNALLRYGHLKFSRWPPAAIFDLIQPEMAPFDPPSLITPPQNQTRSRSVDALQLWPFEIFPKCVNWPWGRSSVGRQYSYFLHWFHILLFRYVRNVAHEA